MPASDQPDAERKIKPEAVRAKRRFRTWAVVLLDPFRWEFARRRSHSPDLDRFVAQDLKAVLECSGRAGNTDTYGLLLDEVELFRELADRSWSQFRGGECLISIAVTDRATKTSPGDLRRLLIEAVHDQGAQIGALQRVEDFSGPSLPATGWWHEDESSRFSIGLVSVPHRWDAERSGWEWVKPEYGPRWSHPSACWLSQYVQMAERCLEVAVVPKLRDRDQIAINWAIEVIRHTVPFALQRVRIELKDRQGSGLRKARLEYAYSELGDWYTVLGELLKGFKRGRTDLPWAKKRAGEVEEVTPAAVEAARSVCLRLSELPPDRDGDGWLQWSLRQVARSVGVLVGVVARKPVDWDNSGWLVLGWAIESLERPKGIQNWWNFLRNASVIFHSLMPNPSPVDRAEPGDESLESAQIAGRLTLASPELPKLSSANPDERRAAARFYAEHLPSEPVELIIPLLQSIGSQLASREVEAGEARAILLPTVAGLCFSQECSVRKAARDVLFEWQKIDVPVRAGLEELSALLTAASLESPSGIRDVDQLPAQEAVNALKNLRDPREVERFLERFVVGRTWGDAESNYLIATGITEHLRSLKLRVECPNDGEPSVLRCYPATGMEAGSFTFEHYSEDREQQKRRMHRHVGLPIVPALKIVPAPADLRRQRKTNSKLPS